MEHKFYTKKSYLIIVFIYIIFCFYMGLKNMNFYTFTYKMKLDFFWIPLGIIFLIKLLWHLNNPLIIINEKFIFKKLDIIFPGVKILINHVESWTHENKEKIILNIKTDKYNNYKQIISLKKISLKNRQRFIELLNSCTHTK